LAMPNSSFEGKYLHKDLFEQASAYAVTFAKITHFLTVTREQVLLQHLCCCLLAELNLMTPMKNSMN
jgi:hypothetical protein